LREVVARAAAPFPPDAEGDEGAAPAAGRLRATRGASSAGRGTAARAPFFFPLSLVRACTHGPALRACRSAGDRLLHALNDGPSQGPGDSYGVISARLALASRRAEGGFE
jgi:hypothetical protein